MSRSCEAIGLLLVGFIGAGCTTMIYAHQHSVGLDARDTFFPLGESRQEVEAKLGKPVTSRALPDGGRVDSYTYSIRPTTWPKSSTAGGWAVFDVVTLGTAEVFALPEAIQEVWKNRLSSTFTYDANDRLLAHGPPPPYGPADDAVGSLSLNEIRERCRSEVSGDPRDLPGGVAGGLLTASRDLYDECLVRRLAIWGIE